MRRDCTLMIMKAQRNQKIEIISFMAMLCVVWWHCYCGSQVERWFIPVVCVWSVPWFFFLSGVLFRRTLDTKGRGEVVASKVHSLLIPYILWCAIGAVLTSLVKTGGGVLLAFAISSSQIHPWGNKALWYLRSLLIFMVFTMLVDCLFRKLLGWQKAVVAMVVLALILLTTRFIVNLGPLSSGFYFVLGMTLSEKILNHDSFNERVSAIVGLGCMVAAVSLRVFWFRLGYDFINPGGNLLANMSVVAFLAGLWFLSGLLPEGFARTKTLCHFLPLTAFVYFMHYPVNDLIKHHLHSTDMLSSDCRFVLLCIFAPLLYLSMAWLAKTWFGKLYALLSGGR